MSNITEIHINKSAKRVCVVGEIDGEIRHINLAINDDEYEEFLEKHNELLSKLENVLLKETLNK